MKKEKIFLYLGILLGGIGGIYLIRFFFEKKIKEKEEKVATETFEKILLLKEKMLQELGEKFYQDKDPRLYRVWSNYKDTIYKVSKKYGIPITLFVSLIAQESGGVASAYRYEPVYNLNHYKRLPKEPLYPHLRMSDVVKIYVLGNTLKGVINIPQYGYNRMLTPWEIISLVKIFKLEKLKEEKKLDEVAKRLNEELKKYNANISVSASFGLGQLMYPTAILKTGYEFNPRKLFDPEFNLELAGKHLSDLYKTYKNWRDVLSAYNTGKAYKDNPRGKEYVEAVISRIFTKEEVSTALA